MKRYKVYLGLVLIFVFGLALGFFIGRWLETGKFKAAAQSTKSVRDNDPAYPFIEPLLSCNLWEIKQFNKNQALSETINNYIKRQYLSQNAQQVSVFFYDLKNSDQVGLNTDVLYHPASLLKLVIMMVYFKQAESDPTLLTRQLVYQQSVSQQNSEIEFAVPSALTVG
ncbi:MAG: hypothetical protein NTZ18_02875 [Candidatus Komeilibacteria bacterium]|nr:hypothetical protein [Candidatus Komeilibacteria bacterium]